MLTLLLAADRTLFHAFGKLVVGVVVVVVFVVLEGVLLHLQASVALLFSTLYLASNITCRGWSI